jgi:hypothetical protein
MQPPTNRLEFAFSATTREAEVINFILGQGIHALKNKKTRDAHGITIAEVNNIETIRYKLVDQLLNPI